MRGFINRDRPGSSIPRGFFQHGWDGDALRTAATPAKSRLEAIVALPVRDEGLRAAFCLHALAVQIAAPPFAVLLVVNNCSDNTRAVIEAMRVALPFALRVVDVKLLGSQAHAGWARRVAMDAAAAWLEAEGCRDGVILSSDADSVVGASWVADMCHALSPDVGCVSGRIALAESELKALPGALRRRLRREAVYESLLARVVGHYDPQPHDLTARHFRVSGASLGVRADAYRSAGGLPPRERDAAAALVSGLTAQGLNVRHVDTLVQTSARLHGRVRAMEAEQKAFCDPAFAAVMDVVRVAKARGAFRRLHAAGRLATTDWATAWDVAPALARKAARQPHFAAAWKMVETAHPAFTPMPLRSADLPSEIALARKVVAAISAKEALLSGDVAPRLQDMQARISRAIVSATETWRTA